MKIDYDLIKVNGMYYVREVKNSSGDRGGYLLIDNNNKPVLEVYSYFKERIKRNGDSINSIKRKAYDLCYLYDFMNVTNTTPELLTNDLLLEFINGYLQVISSEERVYDCIERSMFSKLPLLDEYRNNNIIVLNKCNSRGIDNKSIARILNNVKLYLIFLVESKKLEVDLDNLFLIKDIRLNRDNSFLGHLNKGKTRKYTVNGMLKASKIPYSNSKEVRSIDESEVFEMSEHKMFFDELQNSGPSIKLLFNLLDNTGMRISEALALKVADYSIKDGENFIGDMNSDIRLVDSAKNIWEVDIVHRPDNPSDLQIKFNKERTVQFIDSNREFYNLYKQAIVYRSIFMKRKNKNHKYLFINTLGDRLKYPRINQIFKGLMNDCGLEGRTKELTIHSIRHTYASRWIKVMRLNGKDVELEELSKILGHESSETTRKTYIHLFKEDKLRLLEKMNRSKYQVGEE
ncbi:MAG: tyrosine-type recombinase/integrase [Sarcina sp.]